MSKPLNPAARPFVFAPPPPSPSPPSHDNLTLAEDPPAASWSGPPTKLKERIVRNVLAIIEEQETPRGDDSRVPVTVGFFARKEISDKEGIASIAFEVNQLKRLETLDRELRDICAPLAWQALPMCGFDKAALERLEEVLPPHASHVRLVNFGGVTIKPCCGGPIKNPDARARDKVASRLVRMCDNVEEIYLTEPRQQPDTVFQLEHLRLAVVATVSYSVRDVAFLQRQPHLEALSVQSRAPPLGSDSVQLARSLSRFSHLKRLHIKGTKLVTTAFLERAVAIPSPLESVELVSAEADITFDALAAFLTKFSATLVSVDLNLGNVYSSDLWPVKRGASLELPHLATLGVGTDFDAAFFSRLLSPDMPLSFFRLDFFPSIAHDPTYLIDFLRSHAETLERVYLSSEALEGTDHWGECHRGAKLSGAVVDAIVEECGELGIKCELGAERNDGGSSAAEPERDDDDGPLSKAEAAKLQRLKSDIVTLLRVAAQEGPAALAEARRGLERTGRVVFVDP